MDIRLILRWVRTLKLIICINIEYLAVIRIYLYKTIVSAQERLTSIIPADIMGELSMAEVLLWIKDAVNLEEMGIRISNNLDTFFKNNIEYIKDDVDKSLRLAIEW